VHAVAEGPRLGQPQALRVARAVEEALACSHDHRVGEQAQGVDQVALDRRLRELRAPVDDDVRASRGVPDARRI